MLKKLFASLFQSDAENAKKEEQKRFQNVMFKHYIQVLADVPCCGIHKKKHNRTAC